MNREQKIVALKEKIANFKDEDFGEMLPCPKPDKKPKYLPPENVHPRLCFTEKRLEEIRATLNHEDNKYAYESFVELYETECDGEVRDFTDTRALSHMRIIDADILTILTAKAFQYALTKDELYGYEAIAGILSYLKTFDLSQLPKVLAHYSAIAFMPKVAQVYDWCYDLLREEEKKRIACGGTSKICKFTLYPSFPPTGGGVMIGNMCGNIFLTAWASMGIALYDEYPDYYDVIENIIIDTLVPSQNFMISSGEHPQGSAYGSQRINSLLMGDMIFSAMFDNKIHLFDEKSFEQACLTMLHMIRPDGEMIRIGDEFNEGTRYAGLGKTAFCGAYLYNNPILKGFAKKELNDFSKFYILSLSSIDILMFNKPELECAPLSDLPLVQYNGYPMGSMYSRTSWTERDAIMTYMKIGECYSGNHEHRDAGNFQIFHKGILASKSGHYGYYGNEIDRHYYKQTISSNCILVFDPDRKDTEKWIYSGGQRIDDDYSEEIMDVEDWKRKPNFNIGKVLYHDYKIEDGKLKYSCLCGDITKAYDEETVSEVKRYMFSLHTGRADHPLAFFVFDRITANKEHFEKKVLLHMQTQPLVADTPNGKKCAMITNLDSRLYIQNAGSEVEYKLVGGENNQFNVKGVNYQKSRLENSGAPFTFDFNVEEGWGRIEITPKKKAKTDCMLTVMYISPDIDYAPNLVLGDSSVLTFKDLVEIKGEGYLGGAILNNAVIFPENGDGFGDELSFEIPEKVKKCYVLGLKGGKWSINGKEYEVKAESGIAEFEVASKDATLKYIG